MPRTTRFDAIYARQSVDKKDSVSIEAQIDECKAICGRNLKIYKDKGFSGKNTDRPELQQLISDIERGIIKRVVVYKLDRISRNITNFYQLYELMEKHFVVSLILNGEELFSSEPIAPGGELHNIYLAQPLAAGVYYDVRLRYRSFDLNSMEDLNGAEVVTILEVKS